MNGTNSQTYQTKICYDPCVLLMRFDDDDDDDVDDVNE